MKKESDIEYTFKDGIWQPIINNTLQENKNTNIRTAVDLFTGAGGFSLGIARAGFKVLVAVESDKWACQTLRHNFKDLAVLEKDIRKVTGKEILKICNLKKGNLDLLVGGPPCQGFTIISSNRSIDDPRSKLMHEFLRLTKEIMPRVFMIENVPGLLYFKDFFILLMKTMEDIGYVVRCVMMDAMSYGVPQYRRRIFIQGVRKDLKILPVFPIPTNFKPEHIKTTKDRMFSQADVSVKCFAVNGFVKEEVKDLWWNEKLWIQMNRKTARQTVDNAVNVLIAESIKMHIKKHTSEKSPRVDKSPK